MTTSRSSRAGGVTPRDMKPISAPEPLRSTPLQDLAPRPDTCIGQPPRCAPSRLIHPKQCYTHKLYPLLSSGKWQNQYHLLEEYGQYAYEHQVCPGQAVGRRYLLGQWQQKAAPYLPYGMNHRPRSPFRICVPIQMY